MVVAATANGPLRGPDQGGMRQPSQQQPGRGYHLGIDLGTTCTAVAVCRGAGPGRPEPVALGEPDSAIATAAFLTGDGELLVGAAARRRSAAEPERVARGFTRRIGDATPLVLGGQAHSAAELAARFVRAVVDLVTLREGGAPDTVALTHPVGWGAHRRESLTRALVAVDLADVLLVSEPVAAALGHTGGAGLAPGAVLAVYDLGGDSFAATVLGGAADGTPELRGRPVELDDLGGVDLDEHVLDHVRDALGDAWTALDPTDPAVLAAVATLRRDCAAAKEALSADVDAAIPVLLPGTHTRVRIGRADFEDRIRGDVAATVAALLRALAAAGTGPAVPQTVLLVGGSSRIPLVPQLVSAGLGRPITVDADPGTTAARGAALAAQRHARSAEPAAAPVLAAAPVGAPRRPAVPQLRTVPPAWPTPARPRMLQVRGALVAAFATVGIALAAAATAYAVDPTLLAGEAPAALVEPDPAATVVDAGAGTAAAPGPAAEQPAAEPGPVVAAPARSGAAPIRHAARTVRAAAVPTRTAAPPAAAPPSPVDPVPVAPPTGPAPTVPGAGPGAGGDEPPSAGSGNDPTGSPPPAHGSEEGSGAGHGDPAPGANGAPDPVPAVPASPAARPGPNG
jgi:molecular chaperone DnaK